MKNETHHAPLQLGILFGGRSCEHEVSVTSARSLLKAIDRDRYDVHLIGIDKDGHWHLSDHFEQLVHDGVVRPLSDSTERAGDTVTLALHHNGNLMRANDGDQHTDKLPFLDVIFPVLHGTFGEDGTVQGALEMAGIAYVGCGVAASALAMDKMLAKKIFAAAGIPQVAHLAVNALQWQRDDDGDDDKKNKTIECFEAQLGYPMFVKPANMGSSVGIRKAKKRDALVAAIDHAFEFDNKILIEQAMENCREIECAILGNDHPQASVLGEIIPGAEFYDYATKYIDDNAELVVPADLPEHAATRVRELAIKAFSEINGAGLARVDFFVDKTTSQVTLNEINTMPGFTPISMYPKLWAASGVPYTELIDQLIQLALAAHRSKARLQRALELPAPSAS